MRLETNAMMGADKNNTDLLEKFWGKIKPFLRKPPNWSVNESEMHSWSTIKELHGNFCLKSIKELPPQKYKVFVEKLQKRFHLSEKSTDSMLDALDCKENEEKLESLKFIETKGYINQGWYFAEMKDGKLDVAYTIYTANFELVEKVHWVFNWWYIIPIGRTFTVELQKPTLEQKEELNKWCASRLYDKILQTFENSE